MTTTARRQLKMGIIGVGVGATEILPAMDSMPEIELAGCADLNAEVRARFQARYTNAKTYASAEELCKDPNIEAVWVSSPNRFHAEHTILALNHGKHVVVEKPMAISLQEAEAMCAAADKNGVQLLAGHTRAFTLPIRAMRRIIKSGKLGRLQAIHVMAYTDWMLRPRSADELDPNQGGGIPYRQGPHQIDTIRFLGGGLLRSVRGTTGQWMPERSIPGYYSAYLEFEDGTPSTTIHNGYGYFMGAELVPWGESKQRYDIPGRAEVRRQMRAGTRNEDEDKQDLRIGGRLEREIFQEREVKPWVPEDLGIVIVSCERGDIRHSKHGLFVYDDNGLTDIDLEPDRAMGPSQRRTELEELYDGIVEGKPIFHNGRWGLATLETVLALIESGKERREIMLSRQVAVPDSYDADLEVPGY